jgi:uroporphyrinogen-III decarboxylase
MTIEALHLTPKSEQRRDVYDRFRSRTVMIGGIDQTFLLFKGTPEQVEAEVRGMMSDWGGGPGYMIAPGCEMAFKTPVENLIALREAAARYARGTAGDG